MTPSASALAILRAPGGITGEMFFQKSFTTLLRDYVAERGLTTLVKTSGEKGLHIHEVLRELGVLQASIDLIAILRSILR